MQRASVHVYRSYILLILTMLIWGACWVAGKLAVTAVPPFTAGFFQYLSASVLLLMQLLLVGPRSKPRYGRGDLKAFTLLGLTGIFGYSALFFIGVQFTTASQGSIISGFSPAAVFVFAHLLNRESLDSHWQYLGFLLSFLGVMLVIGIQAFVDFQLPQFVGNVIILGAMFAWGLYSAIGKRVMDAISPLEALTGAVLAGTLMFGVGAIAEQFWSLPGLLQPVFWLNILFIGVMGCYVGDLLYLKSVETIGPTRTGAFLNLVPVFGVILSVIILAEVISWSSLFGMCLIVAGILVINRNRVSVSAV